MNGKKTQQTKCRLLREMNRMQRKIRELEKSEQILVIAHRSLTIANRHTYMSPMLSEFLAEVKDLTGCAYGGFRLLDQDTGIPYHSYEGFSREICDLEISARKSRLCICNRIISGRFDPELPYFTVRGSFFTNGSTPEKSALSTKHKDRTRKLCGRFAYDSVAVIPIRVDEQNIGLLYVADDKPNMITAKKMEMLETLSSEAAMAIHRVRINEQSQYMATHDEVTGLPNRIFFNYDLTLALIHSFLHKNNLAVVMLDLDHFKEVNDNLGHQVGDRLLKAVGERFQTILRKGDTVARMGGDEFMLILTSLSQIDDAVRIVEKVLDALKRPFEIDQNTLTIGASVGVAFYPDHGEEAGALMKSADAAMYLAKQSGRNQYRLFKSVQS